MYRKCFLIKSYTHLRRMNWRIKPINWTLYLNTRRQEFTDCWFRPWWSPSQREKLARPLKGYHWLLIAHWMICSFWKRIRCIEYNYSKTLKAYFCKIINNNSFAYWNPNNNIIRNFIDLHSKTAIELGQQRKRDRRLA